MEGIEPKNLTAQLAYQAAGNPPGAHPASAISNAFPGLEMDFRNVWRRFFVGIELHEALNLVVEIETGASEEIQNLQGFLLTQVDGHSVVTDVTGPHAPPQSGSFPDPVGPSQTLAPGANLEWSNALAPLFDKTGQHVECVFLSQDGAQTVTVSLQVRGLFDYDLSEGVVTNVRPVLRLDLVQPGELTQSLCSPWQNDYRECACYYWASNRPDYVNVIPAGDGTSQGHNWLHRGRTVDTPRSYLLDPKDLWNYDDLFQDWEKDLRFIVGGQDSE